MTMLSHRTDILNARAVTRAAGITPKHIERVTPDTPSECDVGARMRKLAADEGHKGKPPSKRGAAKHPDLMANTLAALEGEMFSRDVAAKIGVDLQPVASALGKLHGQGLVKKVGRVANAILWARVNRGSGK